MALTRQTQKVFAKNANADQLAAFGTMKTGTPVYSTNLDILQSAEYEEGWDEAILNDKAPYLEEMNAVQYGFSYQLGYLLQEGVAAYDANTEYTNTSIVKDIVNGELVFYQSLQNNNIGNALTNTTYWKRYLLNNIRNIGEVVPSVIPLTDAGLHLLDGALLQGSGSYGAFVTYIAGLVSAYPNLFTTELLWQNSVAQYGVCGKFVYDSVNNTVRLPKITGIIEGTTDVTALSDLVQAGLPNITGSINMAIKRYTSSAAGALTYSTWNSSGVVKRGDADGDGNYNCWTLGLNASRSNAIYGRSSTVQPQTIKVLYYIVIATATKTDIEINIDQVEADLANKADIDLTNVTPSSSFASTLNTAGIRTIIDSYVSGYSGYRIYSDGYCEQWGAVTTAGAGRSVSLLKTFANTNYNIYVQPLYTTTNSNGISYGWALNSVSTTAFTFSHNNTYTRWYWRAFGFLAAGQY